MKANQGLYRQYFPKIGCVIMASGLGTKFGENKLIELADADTKETLELLKGLWHD